MAECLPEEYNTFTKDQNVIQKGLRSLHKEFSARKKLSKFLDLFPDLCRRNGVSVPYIEQYFQLLREKVETAFKNHENLHKSLSRYKRAFEKTGYENKSIRIIEKGENKIASRVFTDSGAVEYDILGDVFSIGYSKHSLFEDINCNPDQFREIFSTFHELVTFCDLIEGESRSTFRIIKEIDAVLGRNERKLYLKRFEEKLNQMNFEN